MSILELTDFSTALPPMSFPDTTYDSEIDDIPLYTPRRVDRRFTCHRCGCRGNVLIKKRIRNPSKIPLLNMKKWPCASCRHARCDNCKCEEKFWCWNGVENEEMEWRRVENWAAMEPREDGMRKVFLPKSWVVAKKAAATDGEGNGVGESAATAADNDDDNTIVVVPAAATPRDVTAANTAATTKQMQFVVEARTRKGSLKGSAAATKGAQKNQIFKAAKMARTSRSTIRKNSKSPNRNNYPVRKKLQEQKKSLVRKDKQKVLGNRRCGLRSGDMTLRSKRTLITGAYQVY